MIWETLICVVNGSVVSKLKIFNTMLEFILKKFYEFIQQCLSLQ